MDYLLLTIFAVIGILSFAYSIFARPTGFFLVLFAIPSMIWLAAYTFHMMGQTSAVSVLEWTGTAQMGELTAVLAGTGFTIFLCGGHQWKTTITE